MNPEFDKNNKRSKTKPTARVEKRLAPVRKGKIPVSGSVYTTLKGSSGSVTAPDDFIEAKHAIANRNNRVKRSQNSQTEQDDDKKDEGSSLQLTSPLRQDSSSAELSPEPGAYGVSVPMVDEETGRQEVVTTSPPPVDPVITEAELVDAVAERQRLETERSRIRDQAFKEIVENATPAEVVDDSMERKRRCRLLSALVMLSVISIAVAVSLGVVLGSKDDSVETIVEVVRVEFGDSNALDQEGTPQYRSVDWMANNDTSLVWPLETEDDIALFRQRYAMCVLSFSTDINNWDNRARWLEPISECQWSGLTCDDNGRLIGISVGFNNLNGTVPTEFGRLTDLKYLFLFDNPALTGSLPTELGEMKSLVSLYAQGNSHEGPLPTELGKLAYLENLDLSGNQFTGNIPLQFSGMHELVDMNLSGNNLSGAVPFTFWHLQRLETLLIHNNKLEGEIPTDLGAMVELERLEMQNNLLTGQIPSHFASLVQLQTLDVSGNLLAGGVPTGICDLRRDLPFHGLNIFQVDCDEVTCSCCTNCG